MNKKTSSLTSIQKNILLNQSTERPFTGEYTNTETAGTYLCRQCGFALYRSYHKFHSGCGWPSFDEEIPDAVEQRLDRDGHRIEIICRRCHGHLGHVFHGEAMTPKNIRHCVNSTSLDFVSDKEVNETEEAIFAAGCFWGVEYYFKKLEGVLKTEVGFMGGKTNNPSYEEVCTGKTGHIEAIRVLFDSKKINYTTLTKYFFEIHDPTQTNGQGPDLGEQYRSVIFYYNREQEKIAKNLIALLQKKNLSIATQVLPVAVFWRAEEYHQQYYNKTGKHPHCHHYVKRFDETS